MPVYETEQDRANQRIVAQHFCDNIQKIKGFEYIQGAYAKETPKGVVHDSYIYDGYGTLIALIEVKCRTAIRDDCEVQVSKIVNLTKIGFSLRTDVFFVFRDDTGVYAIDVNLIKDEVYQGGNVERDGKSSDCYKVFKTQCVELGCADL